MNEVLLYTILTLTLLGVLSALILYYVAEKFKVDEDQRIDVTESMLPGANCGGCGYPGCRGFADALVKNDDISALYCPVAGSDTMKAVAKYLGKEVQEKEPQVAVVRCGGSCAKRPNTNFYDGVSSCVVSAMLYGGDTGCTYGCLSMGDCVAVCCFGAIRINPETLLAEVEEAKCTACGMCVGVCPNNVIEMRRKGPKNRRIYVNCVNQDKGSISRRECEASCIACKKCQKVCTFEAITIKNNLAYIDADRCRICRKCVPECSTKAIVEMNFPPAKNRNITNK